MNKLKKIFQTRITSYLENECCFRDYIFQDTSQFGQFGLASSINLLKPTEQDLDNALHTFCRDGYETIVIYL